MIVGCASQKGGVAKSSLARLIARELARDDRRVLLADLDVLQATSLEWARRRAAAGALPAVAVECCADVQQAIKRARRAKADVLVLDAPGYADAQTLALAKASDAVLIPSGLAVDDLQPAVRLAHELTRAGVPKARIAMALCRAGDSAAEIAEAARYLGDAGYRCLPGAWLERAGYRRAHDEGLVATEARHSSLRRKAAGFVASVIQFVESGAQRRKEDTKHG